MTSAGLRIASRADGSHVPVAVFIVNNRPETRERIRPHVKVGSSHHAAVRRGALVSRAQRSTSKAKWCAADTDLGFTRGSAPICAQVGQARLAWTVAVRGGPGSAVP
jgi:hypothetical protein